MGIFDRFLKGSFINDLKNEDYDVRVRAMKSLGKMRDERITEIMIQSLNDSSFRIRGEAVLALGNIGGERSMEHLVRTLEKDDCETVRKEAAEALGRIGGEKATEALIKALNDRNAYVRERVALFLGKIGDKRAVGPLSNLLETSCYTSGMYFIPIGGGFLIPYESVRHPETVINQRYMRTSDENYGARIEAAKALGKIGGEDAIKALISALKNEKQKDDIHLDKKIISTIEDALKSIGYVIKKEDMEKAYSSSQLDTIRTENARIYNEAESKKLERIKRKKGITTTTKA